MAQQVRQWQRQDGYIYRQVSIQAGTFLQAGNADLINGFPNNDAIQGSRGGQLLAFQMAVQVTATGGNRQIVLDFVLADPLGGLMVVASAKSPIAQPFSTTYNYLFSQGIPNSGALEIGNRIHVQLPSNLELPPQCFLNPYDAALIDVLDGFQPRGYLTKERSLAVTL